VAKAGWKDEISDEFRFSYQLEQKKPAKQNSLLCGTTAAATTSTALA